MRKEIPITDIEKLGKAVTELKKEIFKAIMETWLGKFIFWILDRLLQVINRVGKIVKR